jgi:hypothetical protein
MADVHYKNKVTVIESIVKGYGSINDFRGKLWKKNSTDPAVYKRAQYVKLLLNPDIITENYPVM